MSPTTLNPAPRRPSALSPAVLFGAARHALHGLAAARAERAVRQEIAVLALGLPLAALLARGLAEWVALVGTLMLVLIVELLNTAVERLCDHLHPGRHPAIGAVKDLGAAAVLCSVALAALAWGAAGWLALAARWQGA